MSWSRRMAAYSNSSIFARLAHLLLQLLYLLTPLGLRHLQPVAAACTLVGLGGYLYDIPHALDYRLRDDAVCLVIGVLLPAAALRLRNGRAHGGRFAVGVHDDQALGVACRAAYGLDEARLAAQEALLIRVQNGDKADFGQVQALAQEVYAHRGRRTRPGAGRGLSPCALSHRYRGAYSGT